MSLRDASLQALETAVNQYLALDQEISRELHSLHGSVIGLDLRGTGVTLFFVPDADGRLQVFGDTWIDTGGEPDCLISGTPLSLLRSGQNDDPDSLFSGEVQITGNTALAQRFTRILRQIEIDWEEQLSRLTGDLIAHQVGDALRKTGGWMSRNHRSLELNLAEYLQEESRVLPGPLELENFFADVDTLRDDVERLAARVQRLRDRSNGSD